MKKVELSEVKCLGHDQRVTAQGVAGSQGGLGGYLLPASGPVHGEPAVLRDGRGTLRTRGQQDHREDRCLSVLAGCEG